MMEHGILNCERGPINKSRISLRGQLPGSHLPYLALPTSLFCVFPALGKTGECLGRTQRALTSRSPRATSRNLVLQAKFVYIKLVCGNYRKLFFLLCS